MENDPQGANLQTAITSNSGFACLPLETDCKRRRAMRFFWISIGIFVVTLTCATLRYLEISTWARGGDAGFVVLGEFLFLLCAAFGGIAVSLIFAIAAIPGFKGAIVLFVVELIPFLILSITLMPLV